MPYVVRDEEGRITGLLAQPAEGGEELLPKDHPDVIAFLDGGIAQPQASLAASDSGMARVTEDLIDLLIANNLINFTELPAEAQRKLLTRRSMRTGDALNLGLVGRGEVI
ncbi:hypothetical protein CU669_20335 [Paramagnetospirillum kuznetsovii]|uniref:Uncharacterized protein n=1 Tax=Paramagnetospirillum kuznetsovii TaxID=2053833 RepID=A0A364NSR4_9PROT|nr:hypothetical protein [Paramagnetospirillum kuznetsovii]RAU20060.1 hypothetical protein CU669_20335 [Paramagnetospirillum kuznetsovii]